MKRFLLRQRLRQRARLCAPTGKRKIREQGFPLSCLDAHNLEVSWCMCCRQDKTFHLVKLGFFSPNSGKVLRLVTRNPLDIATDTGALIDIDFFASQ
jgi:hypothetical protein